MQNQSGRQAAVDAITGVSGGGYEASFHRLFDADGIASGPYNQRLLAWINQYLGTSYADLPGAQHAYAVSLGFNDWNSLNTWEAESYDPDAAAYFTRAGIDDESYMTAINTMIAGIKSDLSASSFSDIFDCFWIFANQGAAQSLYNAAKNDHHCTNVNSTTFTAGEGYTGNASNMRLATDYAPVTDAAVLTQNSASFGSYQRLSGVTNGRSALGAQDGAGHGITFVVTYGAISLLTLNNGGSPTPSNSDHQGFFIASRTGAAGYRFFRNGSLLEAKTVASSAVAAPEQYILAKNNNGTPVEFYNNQIAIAFFGRGLSDAEVGFINTRVEAYMDALGTGVQ